MENQKQFLIDHYSGKGPMWCAEQLGISYRACILRALRIGCNSRRKTKREEIVRYVREWYPKSSAKECAEILGISTQRIRSVASEQGVTGRREKTRYSRSVKADFFDTWTPESAYVLGFIYADGSMSRDKISFYQNEVSYLEVLRNLMGIRARIRDHGARCHVLSFNCCYLADRLREIGIRERKSFGHMVFPNSLPDGLYGHFLRGFFDGDGSVGVYGEWKNLRISIWGQKDFIQRIHNDVHRILGDMGGGTRKGTSKRKDFFACSWGGKAEAKTIFNWMYEGCGILFLKRKRKIFERHFIE